MFCLEITEVHIYKLRGNGTPLLCDVPPTELNNENDIELIIFIVKIIFCVLSQLKSRLAICGSQGQALHQFYFSSHLSNFINAFWGKI